MLGHHLVVGPAPSQYATVNLGVQCFNPAVHYFRKVSVVRYLDHLDALIAKHTTGSACRENLDATMGKGLCELNDAGFIGDTDQGAP